MTREEVEEENDSMNDKKYEVNNEVKTNSGVKMIVFCILLEEDGNFLYVNFVHHES